MQTLKLTPMRPPNQFEFETPVLNSIVACNIKITGYCYYLVNFINFFLSKAVYWSTKFGRRKNLRIFSSSRDTAKFGFRQYYGNSFSITDSFWTFWSMTYCGEGHHASWVFAWSIWFINWTMSKQLINFVLFRIFW